MAALLIRHRVVDYHAWRRDFDGQAHARTANGCQHVQVFRNAADPHEMVLILTWDTVVRAQLFLQSEEWIESIDRGGLTDRPELWLLEEIGDGPTA